MLITLGVIGVVAAITIPGLITAHKRIVLDAQFKKAKSQLFQAVRLWQEEETEDLWGTYYHPTDQNGTALRNGFYKYLKGTNGTYDRILESELTTYYTSAKGSHLKAHYCPSNCCAHPVRRSFTTFDGIMYNVCTRDGQINFTIDINGYDKGPNKWGVDLFDFDLNENNVLYNRYSCSVSYCQVYFHSRGGGGVNDGIGCTACAVKDNDYFKNIEL